MHIIGRITVEDHFTPFVTAFNALYPPLETVQSMQDHDVMIVQRGVGLNGPFVRILPAPELLRSMADTVEEIERLTDVES